MSDQRRQFPQLRGLSASYSQLRRTGVQNSNVSRMSVRNQGATPEIVVAPLPNYTVPSVQEPFFDEFAMRELRTGRIPSDGRQQSFQSLLFYGESSDMEGELNTPSSTQLPLEWSSLWLNRGDESSGYLESAASETIRRSSAAQELDNAVSSRFHEQDNFIGAHERENVASSGVYEFENVVSAGIQEFEKVSFSGARNLKNAVSSGILEFENVVFHGVHELDNDASAGVQDLENVVSSGLERKRPRLEELEDEENEGTKEERKVQKRRESNRISAQRCRERKKLSEQQTETEMEKLRNENSQLRDHLYALRGENAELECRIRRLEALAQSMLSKFDRKTTGPGPARGSTPDFNYHMERRYF